MMLKINLKNIYAWPLSRQLLILGLICIGTFYLGYRLDLADLKVNLDNTIQQENDLKQQLETSIKKQSVLNRELAQYTQLEQLRTVWQKKLIRHSDLPELLNQILKLGADNHLYFNLFNPGEDTNVGDYNKIPIKVIVVGSYHQVADFISQVANMPWIVAVTNFVITNENKNDVLGTKLAQQANTQNLLTAEMTLDVYHIAEKKPVVKDSTKPGKKQPNSPSQPSSNAQSASNKT